MQAEQIIRTIQEALDAGRPVYLTDGTVTRSVTAAEIDGYGLRKLLTISTETAILQFELSLCGYLVPEWGLAELSDGLYFAPDWWIEL